MCTVYVENGRCIAEIHYIIKHIYMVHHNGLRFLCQTYIDVQTEIRQQFTPTGRSPMKPDHDLWSTVCLHPELFTCVSIINSRYALTFPMHN